jgi:hypothetical protein
VSREGIFPLPSFLEMTHNRRSGSSYQEGGHTMKPFALFIIFSLLLSASLWADHGVPGCGVPEVDRDTADWVNARLNSHLKPPGPAPGGPQESIPPSEEEVVLIPPDTEVEVAFHVVTSGAEGKIGEEVVAAVIENLNWAYRETPFRFELRSVDFTDNKPWFEQCGLGTGTEAAMKEKLAVDPAHVLNIYSCKPVGGKVPPGTVGIGSFPWKDLDKPWLHGVVIDPDALPTGKSLPGRHRGLTVAHEVGHYLGLIHTFQGGCADRDDVADTPAQSGPSMKCAVEAVDSCPDRPGLDDIRNIMNYTDDDCMAHFTPGQVERMVKAVAEFRPGLGGQTVALAMP